MDEIERGLGQLPIKERMKNHWYTKIKGSANWEGHAEYFLEKNGGYDRFYIISTTEM